MFKPYTSFDKEETFRLEREVPSDANDQYKQNLLQHAQAEFGRELFDILMRCKNPAVVSINTEIVEAQRGRRTNYYEFDKIIISATITPVQYQHIVMPDYVGVDWSRVHINEHRKSVWQKIKNFLSKH